MYGNVFLVNSFLFCGDSRWCVPGRHRLLLERVTFHGSLCSKRFRSPVHLERHGHELMRSMLTHWSESSYHGCLLLVFPNDSARSFSWRGMDVKTAGASIVISQSHVCPRVCYMHYLWRVTVTCVVVKPSWHCVAKATGTLLTLCMEMFSLSTRSFFVESHGGAFQGGTVCY